MTWTYSGAPGSSELDETRFYIQDTEESFQLLSDEELNFLLTKYMPVYGSTLAVGALACEILAARFAREVNVSADGVSVSTGDLMARYNDLAASLRDQYKELGSGGLAATLDAMFSDVSLLEIEPLVFGIGFMDNYRVGQQDFGYYSPGESTWNDNAPVNVSSRLTELVATEEP